MQERKKGCFKYYNSYPKSPQKQKWGHGGSKKKTKKTAFKNHASATKRLPEDLLINNKTLSCRTSGGGFKEHEKQISSSALQTFTASP